MNIQVRTYNCPFEQREMRNRQLNAAMKIIFLGFMSVLAVFLSRWVR